MIKITNITVKDIRFPTSKDLTGSDAIHKDPDYSATYVTIETSENNLKDLKKEHDRLSGEVIPTMMAEMGLSHLKLADGSTVDVKANYSANISIANREKAFNWLRENGLGDIIKNEISVSFGRNEDNKAADYAALAEERGYQPTQKLKVEPMTLKALVRERLEAGKSMPTEIFNVFVGNKTTIKRNK